MNLIHCTPFENETKYFFFWVDSRIRAIKVNVLVNLAFLLLFPLSFCHPAFFVIPAKAGIQEKQQPVCHAELVSASLL